VEDQVVEQQLDTAFQKRGGGQGGKGTIPFEREEPKRRPNVDRKKSREREVILRSFKWGGQESQKGPNDTRQKWGQPLIGVREKRGRKRWWGGNHRKMGGGGIKKKFSAR